jgi:hypothetical protein
VDVIRSGMYELRVMMEEPLGVAPRERAAITRAHVILHGRHRLEALVSRRELQSLPGIRACHCTHAA